MVRTTQRLVIPLAAVILLAGCTAEPPGAAPPAESSGAGASAPTADGAPASRPVPSIAVTPVPVGSVAGGAGECSVRTVGSGTLDGVDLEEVRDSGSRSGATGTVRAASDGAPASYLVAAGDISEQIAERFCISPDYLSALNSVRRDGVDIDSLFGGDTLNLRPTTVLTVGDQNGRVLDNTAPDDLPAQTG